LQDFFRELDWSILVNAILSIIPALICITLHELAHGYTAYRLGDQTAKQAGRLTLNPIKHIDIWGLLMMLIASFGWAKPVPINPSNFKNPKRGMAITALAGPVSNVLIAAVALLIYGVLVALVPMTEVWNTICGMVWRTAYLSVALAVFNILPIPPLDGSKVLFSLLPDSAYFKLMRVEKFGFILLIVIVRTGIFSGTIGRLTDWLFVSLSGIAELAYKLLR
jgi:Zn-dependent protease